MDKNEILKVKKVRKILLLRINDELKDILKYKSNIKINSKTIPEINKLYTLNDVQLFEKPVLYSHYVKTEEAIVPQSKSKDKLNMRISRSVNKIKSRKKYKSRSNINFNQKNIEKVSLEEDSVSPLNSFFPKKIELGRKKINKSKNKGSIPNINHKLIKLIDEEKENKKAVISYSTRMNKKELNLNRLIGRITILKDNRINEDIIKENIKKLRKLCYKLRKMKKKVKKTINYGSIGKTAGKNVNKRNALKQGNLLKSSNNPLFNRNETSINISKKTIDKIPIFNSSNKNKNILKISKKSLSPSKPESKVKKALFTLVKKAKKKDKKSNKNSIKTTVNITTNQTENEENEIPDIFEIHNKGLPFFHKTTVNLEKKRSADEEKREGKKALKKSAPKDFFLQRRKSKKIKEKDEKTLQKIEQVPKRISNTNQNKFLNLNYVYNLNTSKKKTKVEEVPINKKILKLDFKKAEIVDNNQAVIKLSKVNNGEIQKKIKKKPNKEKKGNRNSYVSNQTDTLYLREKENMLQKNITKKV